MYTYIAFDWVLGDIRPLIVRTVCTTVRKVVCCMCLRNPNASLPQHVMSLIRKTLVIIVTAVRTSSNKRMVNSSHVRIVLHSLI